MGYYSNCDVTTTIKKDCMQQVEKDIATAKKYTASFLSCSSSGEHENFKILREKIGILGDYVFWHIEEICLEEDGTFYFDDEQKFYGDEDLVNYLKDKVTKGDLRFNGEDGESWGYRFDGKGGVKNINKTWE